MSHRHEISYDPHCLDDLGYADDEIKQIPNSLVMTGLAILTSLLIAAVIGLVG